jgi:hypothetical protein
MKVVGLSTLAGLFLAIGVAANAESAVGGHGGWGSNSQYGRLYDPKTVETVTGEIEKVERVAPMKGMSTGVHLLLKTDKETLSVHLGPAWYIDNQELQVAPKDRVEVRGSRVTVDGKPALIAAELTRGDEVLRLRDDNGVPVWSGWRRRGLKPMQHTPQ